MYSIFHKLPKIKSLNKSILYNQTIKRQSSDDILHFGDIQKCHIVYPTLTSFVNSYYRTTTRSNRLKQSFSIDLDDSKMFCYNDLVQFANLFYYDNKLPIEMRLHESSIHSEKLKHKATDNKTTMNKKELFVYGLNALKLAYLNLRGTHNFLDMTKTLEELEDAYKINVQQLVLHKIQQIIKGFPESVILFTYRKHIFDLHELNLNGHYKDMELIVALYGYISITSDKKKFQQVANYLLQKIEI
ncbi:uncharacterized protein HGUI_00037 [Hanseniaspora guilliermondii]|uniref:Uncharacterized protein n=1 Tax=Hanseniaspora guilliermondii TaxID=56406 RepID=A0A1L0CGF0_9ASCO|nr:uncharacterized protein HGUI_00037 [Hanseniaspora guilliermondii]